VAHVRPAVPVELGASLSYLFSKFRSYVGLDTLQYSLIPGSQEWSQARPASTW
jgi:hypothetical protein